jgi:hypothetical protein
LSFDIDQMLTTKSGALRPASARALAFRPTLLLIDP